MSEKRVIDWESIERDYRAGILSLREIASAHEVSHVAVTKHAKRDGWDRDLAARIQAKADALVNRAMVNSLVTKEGLVTEREIVADNAVRVATVRIRHRTQIERSFTQAERLLGYLEGVELLDDSAKEFSTVLRQLADTQKALIGMEREAWGMQTSDEKPTEPPKDIDHAEGARRVAFVLAKAATLPSPKTVH